MERYLYSVEKVANLLDLHQKTILRYIKEGRIKANKVGGRWRIHGNDLSHFVGRIEHGDLEGLQRPREKREMKAGVSPEPWVSTVVHGENVDREDAIRISNTMTAVTNTKEKQDRKSRVDTVYFEEDLKIQVLIWGSLGFTQHLLKILEELFK
jgi:excisionase family DNA binding protein